MLVKVCPEYYCGTDTTVEIPDIQDWKDVKDWYVKWNTLRYTLDNINWKEIELNYNADMDMKRPTTTQILTMDYELIDEVDG